MTLKEERIVGLLRELKEKYGMVAVKGEFEAEGASYRELVNLRNITLRAGVDLVLKIGGCEAISDLCAAREVGVDAVVAPMIESPFAAKKFFGAVDTVCSSSGFRPDILLNIETADGVDRVEQIFALEQARSLSGVDIGRMDMAGSYGLTGDGANSETVFTACVRIGTAWRKLYADKPCTVGGPLSSPTVDFLRRLSEHFPVQCESKKVVFSQQTVASNYLKDAFIKAIAFEMLWYELCLDYYSVLRSENWGYFAKLASLSEALENKRF